MDIDIEDEKMAEKNEELLSLNSNSNSNGNNDDNNSDDEDSVNLCGTEDQYLAIFKACQNQLVKDLSYKKGSDEIKDNTKINIPEKKSKLEKNSKVKSDKSLKIDSSDDEDNVLPVIKTDKVNKDIIFLDDKSDDDDVVLSARVSKRSRRKSPQKLNKDKGTSKSKRGKGRPKKSNKNSSNNNIVPITLDDSDDESQGKSNGIKSKADEPLITYEDLEPEPFMFNVRVRFEETIHRFRVSSEDRVTKCKVHLSNIIKIDQDDLIIFRDRDDYETIDESKTFEDANIGCDVILEAFRKSHPIVKIMTGQVGGGSPEHDPNMIRLKLQGSSKTDLLILEFNKSRPFSDLCKRYATKKKLDPSKIKLKFDGEFLDMESNCVDEDLEGDEVIDVIIKD